MKKLKKRRKYEKFLTSHFSGRMQKFDKMNDFGDSEDEEIKDEVHDETFDETGLFYSWECVSLVKMNDRSLTCVSGSLCPGLPRGAAGDVHRLGPLQGQQQG